MTKKTIGVLYSVVLIAAVVSVDVLFFRNQFQERLLANIALVLVFGAFYVTVLKNMVRAPDA